ncbi:MAG: chemotaxis protein CheW [Sandaracinaceae bacterium]
MAQYCTFHVSGLFFGVEVSLVQEVLRPQRMTHVPLAPDLIGGLLNLRGEIVTAIDLRRRLDLEASPEEPMNVVLRRPNGAAVSLLVDRIGDVLDVPEATFEEPPVTLSGVTRALVRAICKLEDELLLILDAGAAARVGVSEDRGHAAASEDAG